MQTRELIEKLLAMVESSEWHTRNAGENIYCPHCADPKNRWEDQKAHNPNCEWVAVVIEARNYLDARNSTGGKLMEVFIEDTEEYLRVWADGGLIEVIRTAAGVVRAFKAGSPPYIVYLDKRYDRECVKRNIETAILNALVARSAPETLDA